MLIRLFNDEFHGHTSQVNIVSFIPSILYTFFREILSHFTEILLLVCYGIQVTLKF
ncbi:hypothetical protein MTMBA_03390 [Moorella thermoacetica]